MYQQYDVSFQTLGWVALEWQLQRSTRYYLDHHYQITLYQRPWTTKIGGQKQKSSVSTVVWGSSAHSEQPSGQHIQWDHRLAQTLPSTSTNQLVWLPCCISNLCHSNHLCLPILPPNFSSICHQACSWLFYSHDQYACWRSCDPPWKSCDCSCWWFCHPDLQHGS